MSDNPSEYPRIIVCGGRDFQLADVVNETLDAVVAKIGPIWVIHGACGGADLLAEEWAKSREMPYSGIPAPWKTKGNAAGPIRNGWMAGMEVRGVVAFPGGRGTKNMTEHAVARGIPVMWR